MVWGSAIKDVIISMKPKIPHNAGEKKLSWEILLFVFHYGKPLVAYIIKRFWENTTNTPLWKEFHPYIPSKVAMDEEVTWRFQAFIEKYISWLLKGKEVMLKQEISSGYFVLDKKPKK